MHDEPQRTIEELKQRQHNIVWPDAMKNSRRVDELLWKGDPKAPLVQRIGIGLFGFMFALGSIGLVCAVIARKWEPASLLAIFIALGFMFVDLKMLGNAFRRERKDEQSIR